ncbi:MAG: hypothetical protein Q9211_001496 [Gyalolechia sp. 1 TL-2023]
MESKQKNVVIVGGSLAGLMQGIMIKRLGHDVHVLEKAASLRAGQAAGITAGPEVQAFLDRFDLTHQPYSIPALGVQMINKESQKTRFFRRPMQMTAWSVLYYRLRANFDGLASELCPEPPRHSVGDGRAIFDALKEVTDVKYAHSVVTVQYQGLSTGQNGELKADMVVAADGSNSKIRRAVLPGVERPYAGYVAWRGTVPERQVWGKPRECFSGNVIVFQCLDNYILGYTIPGRNGSLEPGDRLLNYVWYSKCPETSPDYAKIMTDKDGQQHHNTIPAGKIHPETWAAQKLYGATRLASVFVELIEKTGDP